MSKSRSKRQQAQNRLRSRSWSMVLRSLGSHASGSNDRPPGSLPTATAWTCFPVQECPMDSQLLLVRTKKQS